MPCLATSYVPVVRGHGKGKSKGKGMHKGKAKGRGLQAQRGAVPPWRRPLP